MKKYNYIFVALMTALCVFVIVTASKYPKHALNEGYGAGFFPILLAAIILFLCLILFLQTLLTKAGEERGTGLNWQSIKRPVLYIICMSLFAILLKYLGLLIDAFLFVTATMLIMRVRLWKALVIAAAAAVVVYVGFDILLRVPFPAGVLFGG